MKELSIEQKAIAYDKVREKIALRFGLNVADEIFSQFEMSEDERIRKEIISAIKEDWPGHADWIAWLEKQGNQDMGISDTTKQKLENNLDNALKKETKESLNEFLDKQGEQKSVEEYNITGIGSKHAEGKLGEMIKNLKPLKQKPVVKAEPKFHEGEWIVQGHNILKIRCVGDEYYCYETVGGYVDDMLVSEIDSLYHLWTIQDAKDGDVLFYDSVCGFTFIYAGINPEGALLFSYIESNDGSPLLKYNIGKPNVGIGYVTDKNIYPATKEQRDILFQKMKEAGYEWDVEKKELKITNWSKHIKYEPNSPSITKEKSVWSEEDKMQLDAAIDIVTNSGHTCTSDWLKDLKDRYTWKPSDEQIEILEMVLTNESMDDNIARILRELREQLKKLREE